MKIAQQHPLLGEIGLDNFAPYLMNRIMGRYNASLRQEMSALGLTTPKMRSLAVLAIRDGILIRELAVYAVVEQSTLSRALDGLLTAGLVHSESDPDDNRGTRVFITSEGRDVFAKIWPFMASSYGQMFQGISETEQLNFISTLNKILRNVRKNNF
ncbi:MAG: MarR family transcriptional regulator [Paracoccaceae bacterium]|nr:MarR family transcriptional regulator [Paracoccaceae bacterium]